MSQSAIPPAATLAGPVTQHAVRTVLSLHGADASGVAFTWHIAPMADDGAPGAFLVERAVGDIHSPAVWMQAQRDASLAGEDEVLALVREVLLAAGPTGSPRPRG